MTRTHDQSSAEPFFIDCRGFAPFSFYYCLLIYDWTTYIVSRRIHRKHIRCPAMDICEPHRKSLFLYCCIYSALHNNRSYPNVACVFVAVGRCLPSRCPPTSLNVIILCLQDRSFVTATGYGMKSRGSNHGRCKFFLFFTKSRLWLGPNQPPTQCVTRGLSPEVKRPGHEADHSLSSGAEVKNGGAITPSPPISIHGIVFSSISTAITLLFLPPSTYSPQFNIGTMPQIPRQFLLYGHRMFISISLEFIIH
jgi:hypothetical protein